MTDLKNLLDQAAGDEPVLTDADLTSDLLRGRRSLRRRKAAIGTTVVAGVAVAGAAWSIVQAGSPTDPALAGGPQPAVSNSTTTAGPSKSSQPDRETVRLVASGKPLPGARMWCDLKPAGWTPEVRTPKPDQVALLAFLPPGGGEQQAWLAIARHSASEPGVGGILARTPLALLPLDVATELRWTDSCHEVR